MPSARFAGYTLGAPLRAGSASDLRVAKRDADGLEVVVKRVRGRAPDDAARLVHEGELGERFAHEGLVRVVERGEHERAPFVVFERVAGHDLRAVFVRMHETGTRELPLGVAVAIALGVARALAHAHALPIGIVHRDVAPANVLVGDDGVVRLLDFGLATSALSPIAIEREAGTAPGRPGYVAPEQARGERVDARADVFATGILLFELTTGRRLYRGQTDYETLRLVADRDAPAPSAVRADYPAGLEAIVLGALARDRDARTPSAAALADALEAFAASAALDATPAALRAFLQRLFGRLSKRCGE